MPALPAEVWDIDVTSVLVWSVSPRSRQLARGDLRVDDGERFIRQRKVVVEPIAQS